jgi:hypothetical protein
MKKFGVGQIIYNNIHLLTWVGFGLIGYVPKTLYTKTSHKITNT